jgi:hypothetical protein
MNEKGGVSNLEGVVPVQQGGEAPARPARQPSVLLTQGIGTH